VREALARRLQSRCDRTGESPEAVIEAIPEVVDRLVDRGYVDDRRCAEQLIDRARRQGRSGARIRAQLESKGIDPSMLAQIETEMRAERAEASSTRPASEFDSSPETPIDEDLEAAWRTARKRRLGPFCVDPSQRAERRQRHLAVLARQGFSRDISYRVVDADAPRLIDQHESDRHAPDRGEKDRCGDDR